MFVDAPSVAKLQRLEISVTKGEEFSVSLARESELLPGGGPPMIGPMALFALPVLVAATAVAVTRAAADAKHAEQLKPLLAGYDPAGAFADALVKNLRSERGSPIVVRVSAHDGNAAQRSDVDGTLYVDLKQWGLRRCESVNIGEGLQAGFYIETRMVSASSGNTLWNRNEYYVDGQCRRAVDFRVEDGSLVKALTQAVDHLSGKMANEIRFP